VAEPLKVWTPTIAPAGMDFYGNGPISEWNNSLLMVSLKAGLFIQMKLNSNGDAIESTKEYFSGEYGRMRDICISPDGRVFIATSNKDGRGSPKADDDKIIELSSKTNGVGEENQKHLKKKIILNPNPVNDVLFVTNLPENVGQIEITDVSGRCIYKMNPAKKDEINIDVKKWQPGIYFININGLMLNQKFIVY
jgi:aldose sugar dehydrogenase